MALNYVPTLPPVSTTSEAIGAWAYEELLKLRSLLAEDPEATRLQELWDKIIELSTRLNNCDCAEENPDLHCILDAEGRLLLDARGGYVEEA